MDIDVGGLGSGARGITAVRFRDPMDDIGLRARACTVVFTVAYLLLELPRPSSHQPNRCPPR